MKSNPVQFRPPRFPLQLLPLHLRADSPTLRSNRRGKYVTKLHDELSLIVFVDTNTIPAGEAPPSSQVEPTAAQHVGSSGWFNCRRCWLCIAACDGEAFRPKCLALGRMGSGWSCERGNLPSQPYAHVMEKSPMAFFAFKIDLYLITCL